MSKNDIEGVVKLLRKILKYTLTFELFGALILATKLVPEFDWGEGLFKALFHSVSAFCNAGFDIFKGESLMPYALDRTINITIMILIQIGGLGFLVWDDISNCIGNAIREKSSFLRAIRKFSLHTKLVLIFQIAFVLMGMIVFLFFEYNNVETIGELEFNDKLLVSAFQSVSARTAGMSTVNMEVMNESTKLFMIFLMLIGGAPGSMAGGVKTVTLAVIIFGMLSMIRSKKNITIFKRTISHETYEKATAVFNFMVAMIFISVLIIMCNLTSPDSVIDVVFDTVSSIATVGLSVGSINNMNFISIIVTIILMYVGRVGTITTALAFIVDRPKENDDIVYAKEEVIVG